MHSVNVVLISYDKKEGQGQRGPWTLHLFKDSAGQSYQTFEAPISNRAYGLLNKPIVLEYKDKPAKDPQYPPNKEIVDIHQPDTSVPAVSEPPVPAQAPPAEVAYPTHAKISGVDDRQIQIMRQSALERAIRWYALNAPVGEDLLISEVYEVSEEFLHYFQTGEYPGKSEAQIIADLNDIAA